ncbi:alpha/beta hydrolase [Lelliottia sp. CFBP8978]|uniref:alpha/beta hydrolase n=1 Tax=Lelliottia sp. CFBP8978 TaxID=3096522 RepID=UPI002A6A30D0|nr:alpha/beta fold hydrolase [Lelliottia sp. CFBP8978]MDY1035735.1 alpha/beta fold hydrolase [Lelliottia sp. CFBP8978]
MATLPWRIRTRLLAVLKRTAIVLGIVVFILLAGRIYKTQTGPALHPWHTWTAHEMSAQEIDHASFSDYLQRETAIFHDLRTEVTDRLDENDKTPLNRFYLHSPVCPGQFPDDGNRSFVLMPAGKPKGVAVLLHGLTDSPYSVKSLAVNYQQRGFVAIAPRLPGHGTAPGALTDVSREAWQAVVRLAVREATRLAGNDVPLHLVGYSNGGALALNYALDATGDPHLRQPQQLVLLSPMIRVNAFARFAGLAGLPALLPPFAKAAWLSVLPEYNPFKYNSFPVNAARQSWLLTQTLQTQLTRAARNHTLTSLPPILAFQSVMDSTVSARGVVDSLFTLLPDNGNELVIYDINQAATLRPLFRPGAYVAVDALLPAPPRRFTATVVTNASPQSLQTVARTQPAGKTDVDVQPLTSAWPRDLYSLSHVAIPFPPTDDLYGSQPEDPRRYGINLGNISLRGETAVLVVGMDSLMRVTSNPFYDDMIERINQRIDCAGVCRTAASKAAPAR